MEKMAETIGISTFRAVFGKNSVLTSRSLEPLEFQRFVVSTCQMSFFFSKLLKSVKKYNI